MTHDVCLAPLAGGDRERVRRWIATPEVQAFWGSAAAAEAEIALAFASPGALCRTIRVADRPVGYAHAIDCVLLGGDHAAALAPGTWDCALFIADAEWRGRGLGSVALRALGDEVFATTLALALVIRIPVRSEPAVRAVEAAGFGWVRIAGDAALGPVWVMRRERQAR